MARLKMQATLMWGMFPGDPNRRVKQWTLTDEDLPRDDPVATGQALHELITAIGVETVVLLNPAQWNWVHLEWTWL